MRGSSGLKCISIICFKFHPALTHLLPTFPPAHMVIEMITCLLTNMAVGQSTGLTSYPPTDSIDPPAEPLTCPLSHILTDLTVRRSPSYTPIRPPAHPPAYPYYNQHYVYGCLIKPGGSFFGGGGSARVVRSGEGYVHPPMLACPPIRLPFTEPTSYSSIHFPTIQLAVIARQSTKPYVHSNAGRPFTSLSDHMITRQPTSSSHRQV